MGAGVAGFHGKDEWDLAMGYVRGVRLYTFGSGNKLSGVHSFGWDDGINTAKCDRPHQPPHSVAGDAERDATARRDKMYAEIQRLSTRSPKGPKALGANDMAAYEQLVKEREALDAAIQNGDYRDCGCGFWAYWDLNPNEFRMGEKPVVGVIEGMGRTLIGERGFRAEKARIVGLHLAYEYVKPKLPDEATRKSGPGSWASVFASDYERDTAEAVAKLAEDEAAVAAAYPSARIYATLDALLANHPPTPDYKPTPEPT